MKRDMDIVRRILQAVEERSAGESSVYIKLDDVDKHVVTEHIRIMKDANLIDGVSITSSGAGCTRLTWQGHEFIEATRADTTWNKVKDIAIKASGGLSFAAISQAINTVIQQGLAKL